MENTHDFTAENMRRLRESLKWSREKLSEMSGVPARTIQDIETGISKNPRIKTVKAIATALGVPDLSVKNPKQSFKASDMPEGFEELLQKTSREAAKAAIEEYKNLPKNFEYAKPMSPKEELLSLIERLDSNGIDAILTAVRAALSSDPITSSALDESKRSTPVRKRKA
jgi:transcriptional regulator with XRE-family HTH domain